jgi:hypothetical protein
MANLTAALPTGTWTLYYHAPKEKRWSIDTFKPIMKVSTLGETLSVFREMGDKLKRGMYFFMRDPSPPLWENYQNIRGGSYSVRGGADTGIEIYKHYVISSMLNMSVESADDMIAGISVSPKIMNGPNNTSKIGFYVIKIWNKDSSKFNRPASLNLVHPKLVPSDIMYTPHTDKKV